MSDLAAIIFIERFELEVAVKLEISIALNSPSIDLKKCPCSLQNIYVISSKYHEKFTDNDCVVLEP